MHQLSSAATRGPENKFSRYAWVMQGMFDEVMDALADDVDAEQMQAWFEQFGRVVEWCGSGDDSILPDSVRQYLATEHPAMLAITAGE